jgi:predicted NBD/HSP70 family sugar kinase
MRIGIDLGGTKTEIACLDSDGVVLERFRRPTPAGDYQATLRLIADLVAEVEARHGTVESIGLGTPGSVIPDTGRMKNCNSTCLNDRPLQGDLARLLGREVFLANDADCFALTEALDGAGRGAHCVFGVILGTGVGGGIVIGGRLLGGPNGIAGEWGHNPLPGLGSAPDSVRRLQRELPSRSCHCGRADCVEAWLSGPGLARTGVDLGGSGGTAEALVAAAKAGETAALGALDLHAWQLAAALATVINLLDPGCIVLGGGVSGVRDIYTLVPERWGRFVFSDRVRTVLTPARHGDSGGVLGAARLGPARPTA